MPKVSMPKTKEKPGHALCPHRVVFTSKGGTSYRDCDLSLNYLVQHFELGKKMAAVDRKHIHEAQSLNYKVHDKISICTILWTSALPGQLFAKWLG